MPLRSPPVFVRLAAPMHDIPDNLPQYRGHVGDAQGGKSARAHLAQNL